MPQVDCIVPEEGAVLVVEALEDEGKNHLFEFTSGRVGDLVEGDILPVVLGKRRALREYSGEQRCRGENICISRLKAISRR